jgi:hypothetical protein
MLGWTNTYNTYVGTNKEKVDVFAKDKLFSQSSSTSPCINELVKIEDCNITPLNEQKFQSVRKNNSKSKKKSKKIKKNRR